MYAIINNAETRELLEVIVSKPRASVCLCISHRLNCTSKGTTDIFFGRNKGKRDKPNLLPFQLPPTTPTPSSSLLSQARGEE